ncbi:nucleoside hydrolase [Lysobacter korlensis]|uniref:Nucleoside hydrolase n=1 Tax=Lysobacter korlensis TaxID=553636 RepID=A0ABV6RP61_9GAMM
MTNPSLVLTAQVEPRARVLIDNDFSGDPDDLYQLVHHLLAPSVSVVGVLGSHLSVGDVFDPSERQAENAVRIAEETLEVLGMSGAVPVYQGSNAALVDGRTPQPAPAVDAILAEARKESDLPLYFCAGAGLTDLASALMIDPTIAERMTLVWIGGAEHADLATPPAGATDVEYNHNIDREAVRYVFNETAIPIWQFPRDMYRQALVSHAELETRVAPCGPVGEYLVRSIATAINRMTEHGRPMGETYALGDSPLVLATALQSAFQPDTSSSDFLVRPTPAIDEHDSYAGVSPNARPMRVYTRLDTRLMFEDFYARLAQHASRTR